MSNKVLPSKQKRNAKLSLGRVLILEDDAILALALEDALLHGGASEVVIFSRAEEALADIQSARPDVMILDVHIADRDDGWAMAELATMLGPKPPRIVFSTGAPEDIPAHVAEMGVIFEKPFAPARLIAALQIKKRKGFLSFLSASKR